MARTVEELSALYAAAYATKDADAVGDLYEEDAIYSTPEYTVVGRAAIVERLKELFSACREVDYEDDAPLLSREDGDYAFGHGVFRARVTLADGTQHEIQGRQSNVKHRGPDGNWRIILDHSSAL
jgi:uncharacterized protein (TIGR02246 family)